MLLNDDTIVALATPDSSSAISVIRVSGEKSIDIIDNIFESIKPGKKLKNQSTHTIHLGFLVDMLSSHNNNSYVDQVLISIFRKPFSYTGENMVEISCHGSCYIRKNILKLLIKKGMRIANPGEFTIRSFMNKKLDLIQAEAVADLISSENKCNNDIFIEHIKGTFTKEIKYIKKKLLDLVTLLELQLNFSEEHFIIDDNTKFIRIINILTEKLKYLIESFALGNAIKKGIYVVIFGETNVGKSTFFNKIIKEERSIVSTIHGTTRDLIEGTIILNGILFRFVDTAGIRKTNNSIEIMGIEKTINELKKAQVILYIFNSSVKQSQQKKIVNDINFLRKKYPLTNIFVIANKSDISNFIDIYKISKYSFFFEISSKKTEEVNKVINVLSNIFVEKQKKYKIIVTQIRHYEILKNVLKEISYAKIVYEKKSEDLASFHLKKSLFFLDKITGEKQNEDVLKNIFSKFCIGK